MTFFIDCVKIWQEKEWPEDWTKAIFVLLPKRGDRRECDNHRMILISLIFHASKVLLKALLGRMGTVLDREIGYTQASWLQKKPRNKGPRVQLAHDYPKMLGQAT